MRGVHMNENGWVHMGGLKLSTQQQDRRLDQADWSGESVTFRGTTYVLLWWLALDFIGVIGVAYGRLIAVLFVWALYVL